MIKLIHQSLKKRVFMRIVVLATLFAITACSEDAAVISDVKKTEAERKVEYGPWELRQHITLLGEPIEGAFVSRREAWLKAGDDILATCVMTGDARMDESGNPLRGQPASFKTSGDCSFYTTTRVHAPEKWTPSS
tara:strand:- start:687 stop:1091 length:405 start_codon:yes stop_codon:yes gene_type:complete